MRIKNTDLTKFVINNLLIEPTGENPGSSDQVLFGTVGTRNYREISFQMFENMMATNYQHIPVYVRENASTPVFQNFQRTKSGFMFFVKYSVPGCNEKHLSVEFNYKKLNYKPKKLVASVKNDTNSMLWALPCCLVQLPNRKYYTIQIEVRIKIIKHPKGVPVVVSFYKPPKNLRI